MTEAQVRGRLDAQKYADMPLGDAARAIWNEQFARDQDTINRHAEKMTGRAAVAGDPWEGHAVADVEGLEFTLDRHGLLLLHSCELCGDTFPLRASDLRSLGQALSSVEEDEGRCKRCREAVQVARRQKAAGKEAK